MEQRMKNPAMIVPGALQALQTLGATVRTSGLPASTLYLVEARASQINGCSVCLDMHSRELKAAGEPDERIFMIGAWRESPYFSDAERAALEYAEALTRASDTTVKQAFQQYHDNLATHFDEAGMLEIVGVVATMNVWTRLKLAQGAMPVLG
ncbi:MAG TPA: carboxymuconolactone decarboxylase family protein [Solirubrobacteraceae bacterium]|nr:carboxymuconolactone decarboxylase family protein [Solirubrobacteraceae bacterium]